MIFSALNSSESFMHCHRNCRNAIAERRQIQTLLGEARKLMEEMK